MVVFFENCKLTAQISGYITTSSVVIGTSFATNEELIEIINPDHLHAELSVFESDAVNIRPGQYVSYMMLGDSEVGYSGLIESVGKSVDNASKTIKCIGNFNKGGLSIAGAFVNAEIHISLHHSYGLPSESIFDKGNEKYILTISEYGKDDYLVVPKVVKTGVSYQGYTEILSQLNNTRVLISGGSQLPWYL